MEIISQKACCGRRRDRNLNLFLKELPADQILRCGGFVNLKISSNLEVWNSAYFGKLFRCFSIFQITWKEESSLYKMKP